MQTVGTHDRPNLGAWEEDIPDGTPFVTTKAGNRYYNVDMDTAEMVDEHHREKAAGTAKYTTLEDMDKKHQLWLQEIKQKRALAQGMVERERIPYLYQEEMVPTLMVAEPIVEYKTRAKTTIPETKTKKHQPNDFRTISYTV